jgi:hypothetical protein
MPAGVILSRLAAPGMIAAFKDVALWFGSVSA